MFIYKVTYKTGKTSQLRANSPKQAFEVASVFGEVTHVKWLR